MSNAAVRRSSHQTGRLRERLAWPSERPFRILSIDGGGIKGLFAASLLAEIEGSLCSGQPVGNFFDLIAGTSTGGIIATALSGGRTATEIAHTYLERGAEIFPPSTGIRSRIANAYARHVRGLWRYRYETRPLQILLEDLLGDRILGDTERRLCVPAFDGNFNEVHVFKTPHHPDFQLDWRERMVDVALATAAAPTFFSVYHNKGRQFADGGVWANNPVMIALVDALSCFDLERRAIHILSIGSGERHLGFKRAQVSGGGLWHWRAIIEAAIALQTQSADGQARALVGPENLVRIVPSPSCASLALDDYASAARLLPADAKRALGIHREGIIRFFGEPSEAYQAYHGPRS